MRWRRRRAQKKAYAAVARFRRTCHVCAQGLKPVYRRTMNLDGFQKAIKGTASQRARNTNGAGLAREGDPWDAGPCRVVRPDLWS